MAFRSVPKTLLTLAISALLLQPLAAAAKTKYPIRVFGSDERSFNGAVDKLRPVQDRETYDAVVVGGGLAGLTAALYLADAGKQVLVLEKEMHLGGLAAGGVTPQGAQFGRGASYFTRAYEEEGKILERIGMGDYLQQFPIHEPSDSYFWNGKLYLGIWEEETMHQLPASFALFHHELLMTDKEGLIPNQPFEESDKLFLDTLTAADWIKQMPLSAARRSDAESQAVYERFLGDQRLDRHQPMKDVMGLMELYCRSALGATPDKISAIAFANFYISEVETRYTTPTGTGGAAEKLLAEVSKLKDKVTLKLGTPVTGITADKGDKAEVRYQQGNELHRVQGDYVVFAAPMKFAPTIIDGFAQKDPERTRLLQQMPYAHYNVHNVQVKGHPYRATYDTWTRARDYRDRDFCDVILGRWMDPVLRGYEGMRDFKKHPADNEGILSLYQPLSLSRVGGGYTLAEAQDDAEYSVNRMLQLYGPLLKSRWGTSVEVQSVTTSRWPYSIHIAEPGHFTSKAKVLRKPYGRVFFANNNIGTPTFEEALFRGHAAANNILKRFNPGFQPETWTKAPMETVEAPRPAAVR